MSGYAIFLFPAAAGAILSAAATRAVRRASIDRGFVDRPGGHKAHATPVALGGGLAILFAVAVPMWAGAVAARFWRDAPPRWIPSDVAPHVSGVAAKSGLAAAILLAAGALCVIGLIDDARPIQPAVRLVIHAAVAAALVLGFDLRLMSHFGPVVSAFLTIGWIVTLINSFNFLDNMDGLAAGVGALCSAVFAMTALRAGQVFVPACCGLLAGALLGFLLFNFHPASIFMGDAGSTVIGFLLAVFTILTSFADPRAGQGPLGVIAPLVVMAVPLYDTISVFLIRLRSGVPIWRPDRRHFSHRLVRRGMSIRRAVALIWLATLVTALPALLLPRADWPLAAGIVAQTILVVLLVALLEGAPSHDAQAH